jgi:hypothetical protein
VKVFTPPACKEYSKDLFQVINSELREKTERLDSFLPLFLSFFACFSHIKSELDGNLMEQVIQVRSRHNLQTSHELKSV